MVNQVELVELEIVRERIERRRRPGQEAAAELDVTTDATPPGTRRDATTDATRGSLFRACVMP
jgi:hypothetical protein